MADIREAQAPQNSILILRRFSSAPLAYQGCSFFLVHGGVAFAAREGSWPASSSLAETESMTSVHILQTQGSHCRIIFGTIIVPVRVMTLSDLFSSVKSHELAMASLALAPNQCRTWKNSRKAGSQDGSRSWFPKQVVLPFLMLSSPIRGPNKPTIMKIPCLGDR